MSTKKKAPTFNPLSTKEAAQMRQKRAGGRSAAKSAAKSSGRATGKDGDKAPPPEPMADLSLQEPPFLCYFDDRKGRYYYADNSERWIGVGIDDLRRELRASGIDGKNEYPKLISPQDRVLRTIQRTKGIDFAGPLAGHFAGFVEMNGARLLVTTSPKLPEPREGDFTTLDKFLREEFGVESDPFGALQNAAFCLWAARGWRAIKEGKPLKGHALILAGPAGCGKNILQEKFITPLLGGRAVKAGDYLLGRTEFSGSMFAGESVILTDENGARDIRSRRDFGQRIKNMVANDVQEMHHKGRDSMSVCPRWRLSISVNDESEHLQTLPPVADADIKDKVHLLQCYRAEIPAGDDEFESWLADIISEIPAWLHHCLSLSVPDELREERPRFGTKAFQHPELLERLNSFAPEMHLLVLIDRLLTFGDAFDSDVPSNEWKGSAGELRTALLDAAKDNKLLEREISETIRTDEFCGQYLKRLSSHAATKERVQALPRTGNKRGWRILSPAKEGEA